MPEKMKGCKVIIRNEIFMIVTGSRRFFRKTGQELVIHHGQIIFLFASCVFVHVKRKSHRVETTFNAFYECFFVLCKLSIFSLKNEQLCLFVFQ